MKYRILPYKQGSVSAKSLSDRLGILRVKLSGTRLRNTDNLAIINWGNGSNVPTNLTNSLYINRPFSVIRAANKLESMRAFSFHQVNVPAFTRSKDKALGWLADGHTVVARTLLTGNSGAGIVLVTPEQHVDDLPTAPLYTKYVKKADEYRIHVGFNHNNPDGYVIAQQKKLKRRSTANEEVNYQIRNHKNGWVFTREDVNPPIEIVTEAKKAVRALDLDFGAVDVGWNRHNETATVYEVNTACGLEGQTLDDYSAYFNQCIVEIEEGRHT